MNTLAALKHPLAIAMWDSTWLRRRYRGGGFEDWDKALDDLVQRGYNAVRIDAFPHLVAADPQGKLTETYKDIPNHHPNFYGFGMWGGQWTQYISPRKALPEFVKKCGEHKVKVGLSTWFKPTADKRNEQIERAEGVIRIWDETLQLLEKKNCLNNVIYLDVLNELPFGFCMQWFHSTLQLYRHPISESGYNSRQKEFVRSFVTEVFEGLKKKWPRLSIGGSIVHADHGGGMLDLSVMDFIDNHIWISRCSEFAKETGGASAIYMHGHPDHLFRREQISGGYAEPRYKLIPQDVDYDVIYERMLQVFQKKKKTIRNFLEKEIAKTIALGKKHDLPVGNTEGWGTVFWCEHPLLDWRIQKSAAEMAVEMGAKGGFLFNCSSNFCHPHHLGFWDDIAWHRKITQTIKNGKLASPR